MGDRFENQPVTEADARQWLAEVEEMKYQLTQNYAGGRHENTRLKEQLAVAVKAMKVAKNVLRESDVHIESCQFCGGTEYDKKTKIEFVLNQALKDIEDK